MNNHLFARALNVSYRFLSTALFFTLTCASFQNCYLDFSGQGQAHRASERDFIGSISTEVSGEGSHLSGDRFSTNTNLEFTIENMPSNTSEVHWSINRGFESLIENVKTSGNTSQYTFTQAGAHDVLAISYSNVNDFLTPLGSSSKRVVIGENCDATKILEIVLTSGTLVTGQTATFGVKNDSAFSDLSWKASLPSGSTAEATGNSIAVNLASENKGKLKIEVSGLEAGQSECVTYRSKSFDINESLTPHFSEVKVVDGDDNAVSVTLENNDIYKYARSSDSRFLSMEIKDAHRCILKAPLDADGNEGSIECSGGTVEVTSDSTTECSESVIKVRAEYGDQDDASSGVQSVSRVYIDPTTPNPGTNTDPNGSGNNSGDGSDSGSQTSASSSQHETDPKAPVDRDGYEPDPRVSSHKEETFYHYCPENSTSCYFGRESIRPTHHTCGPAIPPGYQKYTKSVELLNDDDTTKPSKIDILFVWDTSGSMADDLEPFGNAVDDFLSTLSDEYDVRTGLIVGFGAISPHPNDFDNWTARLISDPDQGEPHVLDSQNMSLEEIRSYMDKKMGHLEKLIDYSKASQGESLLFSLYHSTQGRFLTENQGHGFYREDAALSVIFLSDENAICSRYPGHFPNFEFENQPKRDMDEEALALKFCEGITTDNVLTALKNFKGSQPVMISGFLVGNDNPGYRKLIADNGAGTVLTVEDNNYDELFPVVTETIKEEIPPGSVIEIPLDHTSVFAGAIEVSLETSADKVAVPFYYDEVNNIVFAVVEVGTEGTLHVEYYAP